MLRKWVMGIGKVKRGVATALMSATLVFGVVQAVSCDAVEPGQEEDELSFLQYEADGQRCWVPNQCPAPLTCQGLVRRCSNQNLKCTVDADRRQGYGDPQATCSVIIQVGTCLNPSAPPPESDAGQDAGE
jgi:hypothetical protein